MHGKVNSFRSAKEIWQKCFTYIIFLVNIYMYSNMATKTYSYTDIFSCDNGWMISIVVYLSISSYSANLGLLMLLKCEGKSLVEEAGEAAVKRLVENR